MIFQENVLVFPGHYEVYYHEDFYYEDSHYILLKFSLLRRLL